MVLDVLRQMLHADGLFTLVTDRLGNITGFSQKSILEFVLQEKRLWLLSIEQCLQKIDQLNRSVTLELELPGLFVSVAPIKAGPNVLYLWVMEGLSSKDKELLLDFLAAHDEQPNEWVEMLHALPVTEETNREKVLLKLELSVQIAAKIFNACFTVAHETQFEVLLKVAESLKKKLEIEPLLEELFASAPESFFCGYAEADDHDVLRVTEMLQNKHKKMVGASFHLGEGFLGQASMIGEYLSWQNIEKDPRSQFFIRYDIVPQKLHCLPIKKVDGSVVGILFYGTGQPEHDLSEITMSSKIFAEFYGFHHSLNDLEKAYQKQKMYLSSLIEIAKLVTIIQEIKSLLTVLVDISINLAEEAKASLFLFLFPGKSKANIVSRGISQDQAQLYSKDLIRRYFGISGQFQEPATADTPWGERALECPISYRSEIRGVICVFFAKTQKIDDYLGVFHAFMTLTNMAIERTVKKHADNEIKREVMLLYESMGHWNKEQQQLHAKARLMAIEFAETLSLNKEIISRISSACLISSYSTDFLLKHISEETDLLELLQEYQRCMHFSEESNKEEEFSLSAQIMTLAYTYLYENDSLEQVRALMQIPLKFRELFVQYILKEEALEFEAPIDANEENKSKIIGFDEIIQLYKLSYREQEVYKLVVMGFSNRDIAEQLFISEHTVKNHITNLFQKLNVSDRAQAIALAYRF